MPGIGTPGPQNGPSTGKQFSRSSNEPVAALPTVSPVEEFRARNLIHSPLLRLPYEIVVHILLFAVDDSKRTPTWTTILPTCHYLCQMILSTPELWGRIYCLPPEKMVRQFEMAAWSPTEIYGHFAMEREKGRVKAALDSVGDACQLRCDRIHTLEFCGGIDVWPHFSWIFDGPFPNLKHLSISLVMSPDLAIPFMVSIGKHLETLSIDNVRIPVSSHLFWNLKNLHVGFSQDRSVRPLTMHQLITMLDSLPLLETLSLSHIHPTIPRRGSGQSKRILTLSHLNSLKLTAPVLEVVSILDHLSLPSITSLILDSSDLEPSHLCLLFPDNILADRMFKDTQNFPHFTRSGMVRMGGLQLAPTGSANEQEFFLPMHKMVPFSVNELEIIQDMFDESHWREFARLRPEVRSISTSYEVKNFNSKGMWCALLPSHRHRSATLFPKLESVVLKVEHLSVVPLLVLDCLRMRRKAGFKLKRLEVQDTGKIRHVGRQPEDFRPLADVFVYCEDPIKLREYVNT